MANEDCNQLVNGYLICQSTGHVLLWSLIQILSQPITSFLIVKQFLISLYQSIDLIVQAKSGTGKTCVFGVIALESVIATSNSLQILILAPTREIAVQIQAVIQAIGGAIEGLKCHTFIGGTIFGQDRQNLKKCHIAVGTPGNFQSTIQIGCDSIVFSNFSSFPSL